MLVGTVHVACPFLPLWKRGVEKSRAFVRLGVGFVAMLSRVVVCWRNCGSVAVGLRETCWGGRRVVVSCRRAVGSEAGRWGTVWYLCVLVSQPQWGVDALLPRGQRSLSEEETPGPLGAFKADGPVG